MKILGHRGAKNEKPENTLMGFRYALECGVDGVEIDIHRTKDGEIVVIHDDTVDRTTDGSGKVKELTYKQLSELNAGNGERIPTLDQVLDLFESYRQSTLFIEFKAGGFESEVLHKLYSRQSLPKIVFKSFSHRILLALSEKEGEFELAPLLYGLPLDPVGIVRSVKGTMLSISIQTFDQQLIDELHSEGMEICVWNCNDIETLGGLKNLSVDWVGTDLPSLLVPANKRL
jgi:glycerophosphoryl diester phosphodiesterase